MKKTIKVRGYVIEEGKVYWYKTSYSEIEKAGLVVGIGKEGFSVIDRKRRISVIQAGHLEYVRDYIRS